MATEKQPRNTLRHSYFPVCFTVQLTLLLAVTMVSPHSLDPSLSLTNERTSIERTYELTKYLEHQLKEIKDTYVSPASLES